MTTVATDYCRERGPVPSLFDKLRQAYAMHLSHKEIHSEIGARLMGRSEASTPLGGATQFIPIQAGGLQQPHDLSLELQASEYF